MDGARWIMWFVKNDIIMSHITGKDWHNKQSASVKKSDPNTPEWTKIICNCKRDLQRFISCFSFAVNTPVVYLYAVVAAGTGHTWLTSSCTIVYLAKQCGRMSWEFIQWCHGIFWTSVTSSQRHFAKYLLQSSPYKWRQSHWGNYFPYHSGDNNTERKNFKSQGGI